MELQLNPESLGRINLSLVSKNGIMTAQFTTQNEISKEAIESQMQVLKDNLTNQGLKVESIEVTVSNFDFGQSSQASTNEGQEQNSRGRNFIQYEEELESSKAEDNALLNNLMEQIGSSVDYTA
jgi:flagellar hook-length control protein FliK